MSQDRVPLGEIARINPLTSVEMAADDICTFVPMEAVDENSASITAPVQRRFADVSKSYTRFADGDVLIAKITPCMENGKCALARHLRHGVGFGSTEFHVIRAGSGVLPEWLWYLWRTPRTRRDAERNMTGTAGQRRVPPSFLELLPVPLPSPSEQARLTSLLGFADDIQRACRYALELADSLLPAAYYELFEERSKYPTWSSRPLGELGDLDRGRSRHRPRNAPHLYGGPYPFVQTGDISNAEGYVRAHTQTYSEEGLRQSKLWPRDTLCITIAANIAKTAILTYPSCFPDSIVGFLPGSEITVEYVQGWLRSVQAELEAIAPEVAQKNINLEILRDLECPVPPLDLQMRYSDIAKVHERLKSQLRESWRQAEHLFDSLLEVAFPSQ